MGKGPNKLVTLSSFTLTKPFYLVMVSLYAQLLIEELTNAVGNFDLPFKSQPAPIPSDTWSTDAQVDEDSLMQPRSC